MAEVEHVVADPHPIAPYRVSCKPCNGCSNRSDYINYSKTLFHKAQVPYYNYSIVCARPLLIMKARLVNQTTWRESEAGREQDDGFERKHLGVVICLCAELK